MPEIEDELVLDVCVGCVHVAMNSANDILKLVKLDLSTGQAATLAWLTNQPADTQLTLTLKLKAE